MNAFETFRGRRLLPLLTICFSFAGLPAPAHADVLSSRLTDKPSPSLAGRLTTRVVYSLRRNEESETEEPGPVKGGALAALAVILVVPAGTVQMGSSSTPAPPPLPPAPLSPLITLLSDSPGDGHISGGPTSPPAGTPEPASLILALTGSGTAAVLGLLRRRRRAASAEV